MSQINRIWILAGQSHMSGQGNTITDIPVKYKSKYLHNNRGWDGATFRVYNSDNDDISLPVSPNNSGHVAYGMTDVGDFLGSDVYVFHYAEGGRFLGEIPAQDDFNPVSVGELYDDMVSHITAIKAWMDARGKEYIFEGVMWWQGQADSTSSTWATYYADNLTLLYDGLVTETGNANLKFYQDYIEVPPGATYTHYAGLNTRKTSFTAVDATDRKVYSSNFTEWQPDNVHPTVAEYYRVWQNIQLPLIKADL